MAVQRIATYRPVWTAGTERVPGSDEDGLTMAVAAGLRVLQGAPRVQPRRAIFITRSPDLLEGPTEAVLRAALRLPGTIPVEVHLGGGPAALDVLAAVPSGTLVLAADPEPPAAAAAAWVDEGGAVVTMTGRSDNALPGRVRPAGGPVLVYDDARLLRERGWRPAVGAVLDDADPDVIVGLPAKSAVALGADPGMGTVPAVGASAPLFGLAALAGAGRDGTIVAVEGGLATAASVASISGLDVRREERPATAVPARASVTPMQIPASAAAFQRAFEAKVGLQAGRCECGTMECPPRHLCLECGREGAWRLEPLPDEAEVYTTVTVHTPVPGRQTPYSLAVVEIAGTGVRLLAPVTDVPPGQAGIGDRGRMVLRRVADRETGPDYGYAFQPGTAA